jgi:hypothetical protein
LKYCQECGYNGLGGKTSREEIDATKVHKCGPEKKQRRGSKDPRRLFKKGDPCKYIPLATE